MVKKLLPIFCVCLSLSIAIFSGQQPQPTYEQREEAARTAGQSRHPKWQKVREAWLKNHPECAACGNRAKTDVQVHHVVPFHVDRTKELDEKNLITLCERGSFGVNCHLNIGHSGSWQTYNPKVREDAELYRKQVLPVLIGIRQHGIKNEPVEEK